MKPALFLCSSLLFGAAAFGQGLRYERWNNLDATNQVDSLKKGGIALRGADVTSTTTSGAAPSNAADKYGARLSGYITAPQTGDYTFYVAGDDRFELWLSPDDSPFAKQLAAWGDAYVSASQWNKYETQRTSTRRLEAGQKLYVEALVKDAGGADHLSVGWSYEAPAAKTATALGTVASQSWTEENGVITASVNSGDIWGTSDHGSFYHRAWTGDGEVICRVTGMSEPYPWAKAGVMIRASLDANSAHAMLVRTPSNGIAFQRRKTAGASSINTNGDIADAALAPWLRLIRTGETITASFSLDGITWKTVGSDTFPGLPSTIFVGLAATDTSGNTPVVATIENFQVRSRVASGVIPGSALTPYAGHANDVTNNGLPDDWEAQQAITGDAFAQSQYGDPDGDFISNLEEYQLGQSATQQGSRQGYWTYEKWNNVVAEGVPQMRQQGILLQPAAAVKLASNPRYFDMPSTNGVRMRGYLTAPLTGEYRIWLSALNAAELWLSTDDTKFRKRKIAELGGEAGTGHGIYSDSSNLFDRFTSQMKTVTLQAGQKYFIEVVAAQSHVFGDNRHISLAWAKPGSTTREFIPLSALSSFPKIASDVDDDYLPDAWESQHGLSPTDNGLTDRLREGEDGDFDQDGLTNREEYLAGTHPNNPDTDGDGVSDYDEIRHFGTSPTTSNSILGNQVDAPPLTNYNPNATSGSWQMFDGGLLGSSFRGHIQWTFTVPGDGYWVIDLGGRLRGTLRQIEEIPLGIKIDGVPLADQPIRFVNGQPSSVKVITPYLQAGTHTFDVDIRNDIGRRTFQIQSLRVFGPGGFDGDNNGVPDWLDALLDQGNALAPIPNESFVSPLFIEGGVRYLNGVAVAADSTPVSAQRGLGNLHWFANVPLNPNGDTQVQVALENGQHSVNVAWTRWNALAGQPLTVRTGDAVKIGAWLAGEDNGSASITVAGQTETVPASGSITRTFSEAGTYPVVVSHSSGAQATGTITVVAASFGEPQSFYADVPTWRSFPQVLASLKIGAEPSLSVDATAPEGTGQKAQLRPFRGGVHILGARIPNGSLVSLGSVSTVGLSDSLRNNAEEYIGSTPDGYRIMRTPIVITDLPPGGRVELSIFRAGITFMDGTTLKVLTAADFVDGVAYIDFRYPPSITGGYCHYIHVYDAQNRLLGTR